MKVRPVSDKRVIRPSAAPLLRKWQDFFRVRREPVSGFCGVLVLSPSADGLGEATGRPKKMEATRLIDHKWPYNENVSPPQSWGCLVLAPSADGLGGSA